MITVEGIVETLSSAVANGEYRAETVRPLIVAIKKVYKDTSGSDRWLNTIVSESDLEKRLKEFGRRSEKEFASSRTSITYKARARRALKMYRECSSVRAHRRKSSDRMFDVFESAMDSYRRMLMTRLKFLLINPDQGRGMEFFPFPVSDSRVGAIIVPSNTVEEDLRAGIKYLETYLEVLKAKERRITMKKNKTK